MHFNPELDCDIPSLDLLTLLFESQFCWAKDDTVIHAESGNEANSLTKLQSVTLVRRLAYVLRTHLGIGKTGAGKDVVTFICSNNLLNPTLFFSVIGAGGIYSAASTALTVAELAWQIQSSKSHLIIATEDMAGSALEAAKKANLSPERVLILSRMGLSRSLSPATDSSCNHLTETRELPWERITDHRILKSRVIALLYSSGTTGIPKGVCLSHSNFVAEAVITQAAIGTYLSRTQQEFEYRTIAHLPVAHISGLQGYFINGTMSGGIVFWMPKFRFEEFVHASKIHRPTFITTVPSIYLQIAKSPSVTVEFHSLLHAQSGAAPMGPELQKLAESKLKCKVSQAWGLTETTGAVTWLPWDRQDHTGSIGTLLPNTRIKIVDDDELDAPDGDRGEILVKGPNLTMGYWDNPEATANSFTADGWFRTGDIGERRSGKFYIVDRKKELIKYKGLQVAPAEIETFLIGHDQILDAAVIGIADPAIPGNEIPRAFVVRKSGQTLITEEQVKEHVKSNLAAHKQLRGGVIFIEQVPRNPSGKILRRKLAEKIDPRRIVKL
ncbi:uncharacterized protein N7511_007756 [Penicillium nucicola]|uniref:uncharacterized protein n=1 Tax=Penicillium nucicola TaxID=1850975 RepID=UPI002545147D|nr:uncharacterized protein N7511_007756 [Penicillium nucicola]KAJ5753603.1 hypothetical protein N7511_007756 [Penicillium nucicola]